MSDEQKEKVRSLSQSDISIQQRRGLYNSLNRRMRNPVGLKPGLVQKYNACLSSKKERWNLLKEFIIDPEMFASQESVFDTCGIFLLFQRTTLRSEVQVEAYFQQPGTCHCHSLSSYTPLPSEGSEEEGRGHLWKATAFPDPGEVWEDWSWQDSRKNHLLKKHGCLNLLGENIYKLLPSILAVPKGICRADQEQPNRWTARPSCFAFNGLPKVAKRLSRSGKGRPAT